MRLFLEKQNGINYKRKGTPINRWVMTPVGRFLILALFLSLSLAVQAQPEINVYLGTDNSGTAIADAQVTAVDFGTKGQRFDITQTFAIENTGLGPLNISGILVGGTDYSVLTSIVSIGIGITETFTITLSGVALGTFNSIVTITSNDVDEDPFTFPITGIITAPFITTWDTNSSGFGISATNQIAIPTTGGGYNYDIYWEEVASPANNGTVSGITGNHTITFPSIGIYRVEISGIFPRIYFNWSGDRKKILTVEQWGDIAWTSMENSFWACSFLSIPAPDVPNLSNVTSLQSMFAGVYDNFNDNLNSWQVGTITDMSYMSNNASIYNQDLSSWDVSNVKDMKYMFAGALFFNQDISGWVVTSVTDMAAMFSEAYAFNQDISGWDVSNVTQMYSMFENTIDFNQPIGSWNVSAVKDMNYMFSYAQNFNQPLSGWNTTLVSDMSGMFTNTDQFNQDLSTWDVSNVTWMANMFSNALSFLDVCRSLTNERSIFKLSIGIFCK